MRKKIICVIIFFHSISFFLFCIFLILFLVILSFLSELAWQRGFNSAHTCYCVMATTRLRIHGDATPATFFWAPAFLLSYTCSSDTRGSTSGSKNILFLSPLNLCLGWAGPLNIHYLLGHSMVVCWAASPFQPHISPTGHWFHTGCHCTGPPR